MIPTYVDYSGQFISIKAAKISQFKSLHKLGFRFYLFNNFKLNIQSEDQKIFIFQKLNDMHICFSSGKEWNPSEVFEYYRNKGLLNGKYRQLSWTDKNKYVITEK